MKDQTYPIPQYRGKKIGRLEIVAKRRAKHAGKRAR